ncbi:MAG: hypothetical protein SPF19_15175, partial [Oliverpabstia sp.]|nr:hypothetical protein [Oliverpabstia sp.]
QTSPHGKRDYAALLLATRLGIRSGDISSMTFKELDFDRGLILLTQHKCRIANNNLLILLNISKLISPVKK